MSQLTIEQAFQLAVKHHQAGQLPQAEGLYRQILSEQPKHVGALHYLGVIAHQAGRNGVAVDLVRQALAIQPNYAEACNSLSIILWDMGQLDDAIAACRQAIVLNPNNAEAYSNLGNILGAQCQMEEAIAAHRQAIALKPTYAIAYANLSDALRLTGQLDDAIAAAGQAIALEPNLSVAHSSLGNALADQRQLDEAVAAFRQAIALRPNYPEAYNNLGGALRDLWQTDEAIAAFRQAIALKPNLLQAYKNLGNVLKNQGQLDEAIFTFRRGIALGHVHPEVLSSVLLTMHYHPDYEVQTIAEEHRHWNRQYAEPLSRFIQPHLNDRDPDRRLRIGYVSPDFKEHAVAAGVLPLLKCHDREKFEVFCYAQVLRPDAMTERFHAHCDQWRDTMGVSDEQMADLIRRDQIDILVDLAGHTGGNRLLVFARKPAPVQVTRLGYPDTTGLTAIDYRITDALADPPGLSDTLHSEQLIRVAETNWIYEPPQDCPEPARRAAGAAVRFGCFNFFPKITEPMLRLWARILALVPGSTLLLKTRVLASPAVQERVQRIMGSEGISLERVRMIGWTRSAAEHLALYNEMTIGLDPFPYNGTTSTLEALWMGVPVISLGGKTHVSRVGVSLLTNVGLEDLIAESPEDYVEIAVQLANDLPRLSALHATLRQRMQQSPLMDAPRFARDTEAAYRQMWRVWCATAELNS